MNQPGYSVDDMATLVYDNNWQLHQIFPDALLMAIFWEETQFNNIPQKNGTAVGFGQLEPGEMWTLKKYGIYTNGKNILNDPAHSVEVTTYYLRHLYESQQSKTRSRREALKRYAGYYFDFAAWRLKLIDGWEACERALDAIPFSSWASRPDAVMDALALSRGFQKNDPATRARLYPS